MSTTLAPTPVRRSSPDNYLSYLGPVLVGAVIAVLYWQILIDLFNDWWTQPNLSQGLLIPPLAVWIAWLRRKEIEAQPAKPSYAGLAIIASACGVYILGKVAIEFFLLRISLVVLLVGIIWTFWGNARVRALTFPLVLLATAIPLPTLVYNSVAGPLQLLASDLAANIAHALGVSVYRDGNVINLAHISLGVEEACSGLNSLSAMMVASVLLGFLMCKRATSRIALFLLAVPLSIAANIVRISGTAVIADYDERFAMGFYHALSGWLIFVLGFAGLYAIAKLLSFGEERLGRR